MKQKRRRLISTKYSIAARQKGRELKEAKEAVEIIDSLLVCSAPIAKIGLMITKKKATQNVKHIENQIAENWRLHNETKISG